MQLVLESESASDNSISIQSVNEAKQQIKDLSAWMKEKVQCRKPDQLKTNLLPIIINYLKGRYKEWGTEKVENMSFTISGLINFIFETIIDENLLKSLNEAKLLAEDNKKFNGILMSRLKKLAATKIDILTIARTRGSSHEQNNHFTLSDKKFFTSKEVENFKFPLQRQLRNLAEDQYEQIQKKPRTDKEEEHIENQSNILKIPDDAFLKFFQPSVIREPQQFMKKSTLAADELQLPVILPSVGQKKV